MEWIVIAKDGTIITKIIGRKLEQWWRKEGFVLVPVIRPTLLAPDKGQAAVVKDNQAIAPCG